MLAASLARGPKMRLAMIMQCIKQCPEVQADSRKHFFIERTVEYMPVAGQNIQHNLKGNHISAAQVP